MIVLEEKRRLSKEDQYKHLEYAFNLDKPAKELVVNFKFSPAYLSDREQSAEIVKEGFVKYVGEVIEDKVKNYIPLKNLLTLSIDSPSGNIGTAHRHQDEQKHFINRIRASRGFHPAEIAAGRWKVIISTHSIITDYTDIELTAEASYD